jgi:hypothetical protein
MQHWPRDESRLVGNPEMFDRVERVNEDDALKCQHGRVWICHRWTNPIAHSHLKDRA